MLFVWFVIGCFAVFRLTWDLTSCTREIDPVTREPGDCEANLEGPFHLYDGIRWALTRPWLPQWAQEGSTCPFCISMWASGFIALLLLIDGVIPRTFFTWLIWTIGMSAPTAFWLRYVKTIYGVPPREF